MARSTVPDSTEHKPARDARDRTAIEILLMGSVPDVETQLEPAFVLHRMWQPHVKGESFGERASRVRAVVSSRSFGAVDRALLDRLPALELIANWGVGVDQIDIGEAAARGIKISNTPGVNSIDVAELAVGMLLDAARGISVADRYVRLGRWAREGDLPLTRRVGGKSVGIVGLGQIGLAIAERCAAFGMRVLYHNRRPRTDVPHPYVATLSELARAVDFLVVATPGGPGTRHLIGQDILEMLGPQGVLINIARGSVVDEQALIEALSAGTLGGAGLDVFENEPHVPARLAELPNVILQPHKASHTVEALAAMSDLVVRNIRAHFHGEPLPSPYL